jgi:hypothetical protein
MTGPDSRLRQGRTWSDLSDHLLAVLLATPEGCINVGARPVSSGVAGPAGSALVVDATLAFLVLRADPRSADYGAKRATPEQVVTIALDTLDRRSAPPSVITNGRPLALASKLLPRRPMVRLMGRLARRQHTQPPATPHQQPRNTIMTTTDVTLAKPPCHP